MSREIKTFKAQEYRRGEWEDVFNKDKDGNKKLKTVRISVEHAELLTIDAEALANQSGGKSTSMFRFTEVKDKKVSPPNTDDNKPKLADLRVEYPDIKATSVDAFLAKIEESKK
jgi:hypothetical protein